MGFFGSLGRALTAPIRATNKVVGKAPGMGAAIGAMNKIPGMQTANKLNPMMQGLPGVGGMGQKPGIGPSPAVAPAPPDMGQIGGAIGGAVPPPPGQTMMKPQVMPRGQSGAAAKGAIMKQKKAAY